MRKHKQYIEKVIIIGLKDEREKAMNWFKEKGYTWTFEFPYPDSDSNKFKIIGKKRIKKLIKRQ